MRRAFTLIEIVVMVAILGLIMTTLSGSLGMSFRLKNSTENNEKLTSKANFVFGELKKNILEARPETMVCSSGKTQLSYVAYNGVSTTLLCDLAGNKIASQSANGTYNLLDSGVLPNNCNSFVTCRMKVGSSIVEAVDVILDLKTVIGTEGVGSSGRFFQTISPRL